ncbi:hypothetical protein [Arthrobacter psychrochitiniphilus]|uniref:Uncharacterized protein n=1 Tax=Arthrobacter psychrochitiniphilus TaxID=291045 RepID=A0A2V3DML9_9MICC|nr:hypothetical protein [Arthrobacter psychrochitiniphilus]NYG16044.1 hypothetical protein [Arthrobacter psychrochitiniphilus]PXA64007.1 hypothetical protein CVS29_17290 [Arthrobacter psychrochitiniphilus]
MTYQMWWSAGTAIFVAFFTTVIAQYLFAPWLEVRKQILISRALERSKVADTARQLEQHLRSLSLVRSAFAGTTGELAHWTTAMDRYRTAVLEPETVLPALAFPVGKTLSNLLTAAEWSVRLVHFRKTREKAPVAEVSAILQQLAKAVDPTRFPPKRWHHARRGLQLFRKLMKTIEDYNFED